MLLNRAMNAGQRAGNWLSALELLRTAQDRPVHMASHAQDMSCADIVGFSSAVAACATGRRMAKHSTCQNAGRIMAPCARPAAGDGGGLHRGQRDHLQLRFSTLFRPFLDLFGPFWPSIEGEMR